MVQYIRQTDFSIYSQSNRPMKYLIRQQDQIIVTDLLPSNMTRANDWNRRKDWKSIFIFIELCPVTLISSRQEKGNVVSSRLSRRSAEEAKRKLVKTPSGPWPWRNPLIDGGKENLLSRSLLLLPDRAGAVSSHRLVIVTRTCSLRGQRGRDFPPLSIDLHVFLRDLFSSAEKKREVLSGRNSFRLILQSIEEFLCRTILSNDGMKSTNDEYQHIDTSTPNTTTTTTTSLWKTIDEHVTSPYFPVLALSIPFRQFTDTISGNRSGIVLIGKINLEEGEEQRLVKSVNKEDSIVSDEQTCEDERSC